MLKESREMAGLNRVMIIGNVGRNAEMRYTPNGNPVTSFSVAVSRKWNTPEGDTREDTEWFRIVAWNRLAENCDRLVTKGRKVYIEGRLQTRKYVDKEGIEKQITEVVASNMVLLDSAPKPTIGLEETFSEETEEEEIPF